MSTNTTNYNFVKQEQSEYYDIDVVNNNLDRVDTAIKTVSDAAKSKLSSADVVDNLLSTSATVPLSANQGKNLSEQISTLNENLLGEQKLVSLNDCTTLDMVFNAMKNNNNKLFYAEIGNMDQSAIKSIITQPSSFSNYTVIYFEYVSEYMIRITAIPRYISSTLPQIRYLLNYGNNTTILTAWKSI